jgi:hypothetical protein
MENIEYIKYEIGRAYCEDKFLGEEGKWVSKQFDIIKRITKVLYKMIPYNVEFTSDDPYESSKEMRERVQIDNYIKIYTVTDGHPFLSVEENNMFRAVHDVWAHLVCGCPFTFEGEYTAYLEQRKYYPKSTWNVLFAEIPAQTCAYYYNQSFDFKQRAIEAPTTWLRMCEGIEQDYSKNSILKPLLYGVRKPLVTV